MKHLIIFLCGWLALTLSGCQNEWANPGVVQELPADDLSNRSLTSVTFSPDIQQPETRIVYSDAASADDQMNYAIQWSSDEEERMSVYISKSDGVYYAGDLSSPASTAATRTFSGSILEKQQGETYIYLYPSLADKEYKENNVVVPGHAAQGTLDFTSQPGTLEGLKQLVPLVWKDKTDGTGVDFVQSYYLIKVVMNFEADPGEITTIKLSSMNRGASTPAPDYVFPKAFKAQNLSKSSNAGLDTWTDGTQVSSDDYTNEITLTGCTETGTKRVAYLLSSSAENLNVYSSKYRITANNQTTTYYSEAKSFPGQNSVEGTELRAFENGKSYRATRTMSLVAPATIINETYKVSTLLGMWNQYGKLYDLDNKLIEPGEMTNSNVPGQLFDLLGDPSKRSDFDTRMNVDVTSSNYVNTPNFLGKIYKKEDGNNQGKSFKLTQPSEVYVTFVSENAWDRNLLGYYFYNESDGHPSSEAGLTKYIVFPDMSRGDHVPFSSANPNNYNAGAPSEAPLQPYTTVKLQYVDPATGRTSYTFPANTMVGFFVMKNAINGVTNTILQWGAERLFTNFGLNSKNPTMNYFASGDIVNPTDASYSVYDQSGAEKIKGLAIYGCKDHVNNEEYRFASMIFMVSTSNKDALSINNTAALNVGSLDTDKSNLVVGAEANVTVEYELTPGITSSKVSSICPSSTKYESDLTIADPLYGGFKDVSIVNNGADGIVDTNGNKSHVEISHTVDGSITVTAKTKKIVKVKALTASELNDLESSSDNYKLVLHVANARVPSDGAFSFDSNGNVKNLASGSSPFWSVDAEIREKSSTGEEVDPEGKYTDYFWTLEKDGSGFKLKNAYGQYLWKSTACYPTTSWPKAAVDVSNATIFEAMSAGSNGHDIKLKVANESSGYNYLTCRAGSSSGTPIFFYSGDHVNKFGIWRVYKVWTEDRP